MKKFKINYISDIVRFIKYEKGIVYFLVNGEEQYENYDELSDFMKKFIAKNLLKL